MQRRTLIAIAALAAAVGAPALAQSDIKIAHIYSKTGPLEAYGKQTRVREHVRDDRRQLHQFERVLLANSDDPDQDQDDAE